MAILLYKSICIVAIVLGVCVWLAKRIDTLWESDIKANRKTRPLEKGHDYSTPDESDISNSDLETLRLNHSPMENCIAVLDYPVQLRTKPKKGTLIDREIIDFVVVEDDFIDDDIPF